MLQRLSSLGVLLSLALSGCGQSDDPTADTDTSDGMPTDGSSSGAVDTTQGSASSTGGSEGTESAGDETSTTGSSTEPDPDDIPAERLPGDPMADCPAAFQNTVPTQGSNFGFDAGGQSRSFWLILPAASETPAPLLLAFNGTGESGSSFSNRANLQEWADRGFIVVAPDSNGNGTYWPVWDAMRDPEDEGVPNADLALVDSLLPCISGHHPVDANRIYATGHSAGGIMTNYVLQRRSDVFAGGIVASGVFSLTSPPEQDALDPTFVMVTWGGDSDAYTGSAEGVTVPSINFSEEASIASHFYEDEPAVGQVNCNADLGHAWLPINDWFVDRMLEHPKGVPGVVGLEIPAAPTGANCTTEPYDYDGVSLSCPASTTDGCQSSCQLFADCAVANGTVGSVLAGQLAQIGFSGEGNEDCTGCVANCEDWASDAADAQVLACIEAAASGAVCGPGVEGAGPLIDAINDCCDSATDSTYCTQVCGAINTNGVAASFFPSCEAF